MLAQETKRKIDSARQILVGKVPDPKAQVEQITTALIYKFMDDMDKEAQELGGKVRFFTNGYEKYAWTKLMDAKLGGHERLDLYLEAITSLSRNPHIPQLFRDIFKDAFLPYRSPETLSMFLKEINGFIYEHSEDLGDAFEYLLSILGSQGDAGQFRTPRHIIDFIVAAVAPNKGETICDPACGTAGFLISAFKHILKENKEKSLTPDERKNLMDHFVGYDISPDMVRLSKVNLYLHGFPSPTIFEYDTLSSEEKWDENFDVMLANPPFMSPRGGIRPHKRFSVQANRSEVLFVDYILEHLRPNGRAGIIVPEGIIFKTENSYKELRKLLVEDGLFVVVSLPAGVFQPYSGVKTNILFFDNQLAKKSKDILFIKIENDGFSLGAQRREIKENDLPEALRHIEMWKNVLRDIKDKLKIINKQEWSNLIWVDKEKIAESGDCNLSGERYREAKVNKKQKWEMVELGEVLGYEQPTKYIVKSVNYNDDYKIPVLTAGKIFILGYTNEKDGIFPTDKLPVIIFDDFTTAIKLVDFPFKVKSSAMKILHSNQEKADIRYLFQVMRTIKFKHEEHKRYWISEFSKYKIPLPPIEVQKEIVEQIEVKQKAIEAAKAVIENLERERRYFGQALRPARASHAGGKIKDVEWVEFEKIIQTITPPAKIKKSKFGKVGKYPIIDQSQEQISGWTDDEGLLVKLKKPVIIFGDHTCAVKYSDKSFVQGADGIKILETDEKLLPKFFYYFLKTKPIESEGYKRHFSKLRKIKIPVPSLEIQKQLVVEAENLEDEIERNKNLVCKLEKRILWKICQVVQNLPHFIELFLTTDFMDSFGWSPEWNEEVERWLAFVHNKDNNYYDNNKNRFQSEEKQRDEALGEYKAAYFIEEKCGGKIIKFEPKGQGNKTLDFLFKDKKSVEWFTEVKSPSWRSEVSKKIDDDCLRDLRGRMVITDGKNWPKCTAEMNCPLCDKKIIFEIDDTSGDKINQKIKELACANCKKRIWNALETEREKKKRVRPSSGSFSSTNAIEDAIRKSVEQFEPGKNNLLIIAPQNMLAGDNYGDLAAGKYERHKVQAILKKYDKNKVIKTVLILEFSLPAGSEIFDYKKNIILVEGNGPVFGK